MRRNWGYGALLLVVVLVPLLVRQAYSRWGGTPDRIVIATGRKAGRYHSIGKGLAREIEARRGIQVTILETSGSLENLRLLRDGKVHFALYQPSTHELIREYDSSVGAGALPEPTSLDDIRFITNLYSQPAHFVVRSAADVGGIPDLRGRPVSVGLKTSGDYAMSLLLLDHFGVKPQELDIKHWGYEQVLRGFREGTLDAAFITVGVQSPIYRDLCESGKCDFRSIPYAGALPLHNVAISEFTIPAGLYRTQPTAKPAQDVKTVALRAQLLTRRELNKQLIMDITEMVAARDFSKRNKLTELSQHGEEFARSKPEFKMHRGALDYYDPDLHPILNSEFVEATEGMRSFVVSILIAGYLAYRWIRRRTVLRKEHRLDRYIRALLEIEKRQLDLDSEDRTGDINRLQDMLDEVTMLRQDALREFSAHEISEDRATDCFVEMCHALSNKINAKLSRQRLDSRLVELVTAVQGGDP